jgi:YHS domain-containing protein
VVLFTEKAEENAEEENPGEQQTLGNEVKEWFLKKKPKNYNPEEEIEMDNKLLEIVHANVGGADSASFEVPTEGDEEDICIRIQKEINPFFLRVDSPEDVPTLDPESEDKPPLKGDFGDYCPVTYVKHGWLIKGSAEFQKTVLGKTYLFAGEAEMNEFDFDPQRFLVVQNFQQSLPIQPPPPKVMLMGLKGAGISTQVEKLSKKYKIGSLNLKEKFITLMNEEKEKRKRQRQIEKEARPPAPVEEGEAEAAAEEGDEPQLDPEIENDPEDFDKEGHERDLVKMCFAGSQGLVIDGTWNGFPEEQVQHVDGAAFANLLFESRRVPETVVILRCKE